VSAEDGSGAGLPAPLTDTSPDGLAAALEADAIGTRILNAETPLQPHLEADAAWSLGRFPDPFRNVVVSARFEPASADRRIGEIKAAFEAAKTPFLWWRAPIHGPLDLGQRLERAGIGEIATSPAMAMDLAQLPSAGSELPAGLDIRPVKDLDGLQAYLDVLRSEPPPEGAPPIFPPQIVDAILARVGPRLADEPVPMRYVGWLDDRPVATSRLSLAGGAAGIYNVETVADVRGRGIGRAITLAPLRAARELGYRIATLQSSDAGYGIYRSIGFEEVFVYAIHVGGAFR
jgi:ribosomal protein S18 acetylase RimI-like enzyme